MSEQVTEEAVQPVHVRLTAIQYEWLRQQAFTRRLSQAQVIREVIDGYRHMVEAMDEEGR